MLNIFVHYLDILFPLRSCLRAVNKEDPTLFPKHYLLQKTTTYIYVSDYSNSSIKAAITANKFYNSKKAALLLSSLLDVWLQTSPDTVTAFVPIPLSSPRQRKRGYNQVVRILQSPANTPRPILNLLSRTKHTLPQTSLSREKRLQNMESAFTYTYQSIDNSIQRIVIIDDVVTTGATMRAAHQALAPHIPKHCSLVCLAIAH